MNINRVIADIEVAKRCCNSTNNPTNDEYFYDVAAYHIQQAIEKELKYILHDIYGMDDKTKSFKTHNIGTLLNFIDKYNENFRQNHQEVMRMARKITKWEASCRYGENIVATRKDIQYTISLADNLLRDIKTLEQTRNDIRQIDAFTEREDDYEEER